MIHGNSQSTVMVIWAGIRSLDVKPVSKEAGWHGEQEVQFWEFHLHTDS